MDTSNWTPVTTNIETHLGLAYGVNIKDLVDMDYSNRHDYITRDMVKGEEVLKSDIRKQWEIDGEALVQIAKYGATSDKMQCYVKKYGLTNDATVYGAPKGDLFVKSSEVNLKQPVATVTGYIRTSVFASKRR